MARPKKPIDQDLVEKLAAIHCTNEEIATACSCSVDTLTRRFADILKKGRDKGKTSLRRHQWEAAQKGNITMLIWLGKQLLDQKEQIESKTDISIKPIIELNFADQDQDNNAHADTSATAPRRIDN